eukprot:gene13898-biopygen2310
MSCGGQRRARRGVGRAPARAARLARYGRASRGLPKGRTGGVESEPRASVRRGTLKTPPSQTADQRIGYRRKGACHCDDDGDDGGDDDDCDNDGGDDDDGDDSDDGDDDDACGSACAMPAGGRGTAGGSASARCVAPCTTLMHTNPAPRRRGRRGSDRNDTTTPQQCALPRRAAAAGALSRTTPIPACPSARLPVPSAHGVCPWRLRMSSARVVCPCRLPVSSANAGAPSSTHAVIPRCGNRSKLRSIPLPPRVGGGTLRRAAPQPPGAGARPPARLLSLRVGAMRMTGVGGADARRRPGIAVDCDC